MYDVRRPGTINNSAVRSIYLVVLGCIPAACGLLLLCSEYLTLLLLLYDSGGGTTTYRCSVPPPGMIRSFFDGKAVRMYMAELCPEASSRSVQDGPGIHLPFPYHTYEMLVIRIIPVRVRRTWSFSCQKGEDVACINGSEP